MSEDGHGPCGEPRTGYHCIQWEEDTYQVSKQWRELPSLQELLPPPPEYLLLIASYGIVYTCVKQEAGCSVLKMDMAGGDWTWKQFFIPSPITSLAVPYSAKIYTPGVSMEGGSASGKEENVVTVLDMTTDQFEVFKTWNRDNLRVLYSGMPGASSGGGKEELCSFVEHIFLPEPKLEILVYDACKDSWVTKEKVPIPECQWSEIADIKLLIGDCFDPAPEGGINIVWKDNEGQVLSWFNSSSDDTWVEFEYNAFLEGKVLEYLSFLHGQLYGMFIEEKDDQNDETEVGQELDRRVQQDPSLSKRTIMKGTMVVETSNIRWEEVLDVGCFGESYYLTPAVVSPISIYTLMG